jgi:hypothetical protein
MREKPCKVMHKVGTGYTCNIYKSGAVFIKDKHSTLSHRQYTSATEAQAQLRKSGWR